ncbi:MAG TPA: thioredoxin family protein [Candidatus Norongarragalinales archaeon]|jgi:thiol-disulfide isomerase/thioredoxin|nr:thioredoxin family protein [Candidatus Norongarragalinales archaeon]
MAAKNGKTVSGGDLIEFYGTECPHCITMAPLIEKLEKELGVKVTRFEVWHNSANAKKMMEHADLLMAACGGGIGVPNFINLKTKKALCGAVPYNVLKDWALGKG